MQVGGEVASKYSRQQANDFASASSVNLLNSVNDTDVTTSGIQKYP